MFFSRPHFTFFLAILLHRQALLGEERYCWISYQSMGADQCNNALETASVNSFLHNRVQKLEHLILVHISIKINDSELKKHVATAKGRNL